MISLLRKIQTVLFVLPILFLTTPIFASEAVLTGEDILFQEIPGVISKVDRQSSPVSVTVITAEDIAVTPARNLYDLLEVYVPGALWVNHHDGPHLGIRGIIADRNFKFLLIVNGRQFNEKANNGVATVLENWDMNNIEKIEVIRGPGSVTYGPGAMAGIISITTKDAVTNPGTHVGGQFVSDYNSYNGYISHGLKKEDFELYLRGSLTTTEGIDPHAFNVDSSNNAGFVGTTDFPSSSVLSQPVQNYFSDFKDLPQGEFDASLSWGEGWRWWSYYSNLGTTRNGVQQKIQLTTDGGFENVKESRVRHAGTVLENEHDITDRWHQQIQLSYDSFDVERRSPGNTAGDPYLDNVKNLIHNYAQDEWFARLLTKYDFNEILHGALGGEFAYNHWGPGWADDPKQLRMGENDAISGAATTLISGPDSEAVGTGPNGVRLNSTTFFVGDGWETNTFSIFGELNGNFDPRFNVIVSGRVDKNDQAGALVSPRLALISDQGILGLWKFIWQKSVRLTTATQLELAHLSGGKGEPERLEGYEIIWEQKPFEKISWMTSAFYDDLTPLGWSNTQSTTTILGKLSLYGIESEMRYNGEKWNGGLNHSFVKQDEFELAAGLPSSGISYADYGRLVSGVTLDGAGNDLNNWSNHATKLFANFNLTKKCALHVDTHVFWNFEGAKDGHEMLEDGAQGTASEAAVQRSLAAARDHNAYSLDMRGNVSLLYRFSEDFSITLFAINLFGIGDNKRYSYDAGISVAAPARTAWVEEPTVFGVRMDRKF